MHEKKSIVRQVIQNFLLIWLDADFNENDPDMKESMQELGRVVASISTFTNVKECIDFLGEIKIEKVFMIVAESLGRYVIPQIKLYSQIESIYVFCDKTSKVKSVDRKIGSICKALKIDSENCDRNMISITFNDIESLFMHMQLLKELLLQIEDDDEKSINELVSFCRQETDIDPGQIEDFEREYRNLTPIWWYTSNYFLCSMLNRALRLMDTNIILKMGFFIRHLYDNIERLYNEQQLSWVFKMTTTGKFTLFRGQGLSKDQFEKMKQSKGGLMCFNNFLSASFDRDVSVEKFARPAARQCNNLVGILFVMTIDTELCTKSHISFADISKVSCYKNAKKEILFTAYTIFRINDIRQMYDNHSDRLWEVYLTMTSKDDHDLKTGKELAYLGKSKANHPDLSNSYSSIGLGYYNMGEYFKALSAYQQALEIQKMTFPSDHPNLARSYNSIGLVYDTMGEYSKSLASYEQALKIQQITLPSNHLDLATSYNNVGLLYSNMGEYSKALASYEQALQIQKETLHPNHPNLGLSYMNIGNVHYSKGEYSKALALHEQALEIQKEALPLSHPDLALSYMNIGNVHYSMGEYSKAFASHKQALEIQKRALPPNHPNMASSYNNIGLVYDKMGDYSKALATHQNALEIRQMTLPLNHPYVAGSHNNIGLVYSNMGEYLKALTSHQQALEIRKIALSPNHPELALSYMNIGNVYYSMSEYSKSLAYHQEALRIWKVAVPPNHPHIVEVKRNIRRIKSKMYFLAFLLFKP